MNNNVVCNAYIYYLKPAVLPCVKFSYRFFFSIQFVPHTYNICRNIEAKKKQKKERKNRLASRDPHWPARKIIIVDLD